MATLVQSATSVSVMAFCGQFLHLSIKLVLIGCIETQLLNNKVTPYMLKHSERSNMNILVQMRLDQVL